MIDLGESIENVAKKMIAMNIWPQHVIETINLYLFNLINAPAHPGLSMLMLRHFFARDVIIVVPCILLLNWFFVKKYIKKTVLAAAFSGVLAIGLNLCVSLFLAISTPIHGPRRTYFYHPCCRSLFSLSHIAYFCCRDKFAIAGWCSLSREPMTFARSWHRLGKDLYGNLFPDGDIWANHCWVYCRIAVLLCRLMWQ
ncbi:hypothetical protein ACQ4OC_16080 [Yersinia sp. J1]|uniref:hypothetical protein n=1 Tax=Yersinia sp. J1 TaxID=3424774 RepID=UPI003D3621D4